MQEYQKRTVAKYVLIFILLFLIILTFIFIIKSGLNNLPRNNNFNVSNSVIEEYNDGMPSTFYSYVGTIIEIEDNKMVIMASKKENYLLEDANIVVKVTGDTIFRAVSMPESIEDVEPGETGVIFDRENLDWSDFELGQMVTVISYENVRGKMDIVADVVEK